MKKDRENEGGVDRIFNGGEKKEEKKKKKKKKRTKRGLPKTIWNSWGALG